ncbi:MAG: hypothetical protein NVS4B8_24060 [Herpetosiphon sp.]
MLPEPLCLGDSHRFAQAQEHPSQPWQALWRFYSGASVMQRSQRHDARGTPVLVQSLAELRRTSMLTI